MYHISWKSVTHVKFSLQQVVRKSKPIGLYRSHSLPTYLDPRTGEPTYDSYIYLFKPEETVYRLREPKSIPSSEDQESESSQKESLIPELLSSS